MRRNGTWRTVLTMILLVAAAAVGCGARSSGQMEEAAAVLEEEMWDDSAPKAPAEMIEEAFEEDVSSNTVDRMILYTGELSLVVRDTEATQSQIVAMTEEVGGYLSGASSYTYGGGLRRINLTLRVPAEAFSDTMDDLRLLALEVTQDSVSSEDVTQEYVDLESRLKALEVKADRLEELMADAEDTEAVLAVYEELSETQMAIEETKGRMRYLERRAAMATITVSLMPDELSQPVEIAGWRPQGTAKRALEALIEALQFLVDALIWIVLVVVPVLGFIGLVIYVLIRVFRAVFGRRRARRKSEKQPEPEG